MNIYIQDDQIYDCGGETKSFCNRPESIEWPKYKDKNGILRCKACNCRESPIDNVLKDFILTKSIKSQNNLI